MIQICGKNGSGKTYVASYLENNGLKKCISFTTRPPRYGEVDGKDHHFISKEEFSSMIISNQLAEYKFFNDSYYGISNKGLEESDLIVSSIITNLNIREKLEEIIYIDAPIEKRFERMMQRRKQSINEIFKRIHGENFTYLLKDEIVIFDNKEDNESKLNILLEMIKENNFKNYKMDFLLFLRKSISEYKESEFNRKDLKFLNFEEFLLRKLFIENSFSNEIYNKEILDFLKRCDYDYTIDDNIILLNTGGIIQKIKRL